MLMYVIYDVIWLKSVFLKRHHIQLGPRSTRSEGIPGIPVESSVMKGDGSSDTEARDHSNLRWIEIVYIYIDWHAEVWV